MLKRILACAVAAAMLCMPVSAAETEDLLKRIEDLEARVSALEAQSGTTPEGVSAAPEQEAGELEPVETGMTAAGCTLEFKRWEFGKSDDGKDVVIMYFDFTNESGENKSAGNAFYVKIFQHDREMETAYLDDNQAYSDKYVEFRSGAAPVEVAFASEIGDTSDIIVNISSFIDWNAEDVEFALSLTE